MNKCCILIAFWACFARAAIAEDTGNPVPLADDLVLPLPAGQTMVFRPVSVGPDKGHFAARVFKIGDRAEGGYQETPTDISVGGAVSMDIEGQRQWVYFLSKYEITEAQWFAIVGGGTDEQKASSYPARGVSWFESQEFVHKLNEWLFGNALAALPKHEGMPCFARLPTEAEWEFAARGGIKVSPNEFDRKHPYTGPLTEFEWFSGPRSSNDKVKRIGRKKPNPLGLHDMLGNVAEMTCTQYSVEYYQGRVGGLVTRGGHFYTSEDKIRASSRDEMPLYNPEDQYRPRRMETLGIRLALSSAIFVNPHVGKRMEAEWEEYRKIRSVPTLASPATPNRAAQAANRVSELGRHLDALQSALANTPSSPDVMSALGLAVTAAQNIEADVSNLDQLLAQTLVDAAFYHARVWGDSLIEWQIASEDAKNGSLPAETRAEATKLVQMFGSSAQSAAEKYASDIRSLAGTGETITNDIIEAKLRKLALLPASEKSDSDIEAKVFHAIQEHLQDFRKNPRVDEAQYRALFLKIHDSSGR